MAAERRRLVFSVMSNADCLPNKSATMWCGVQWGVHDAGLCKAGHLNIYGPIV